MVLPVSARGVYLWICYLRNVESNYFVENDDYVDDDRKNGVYSYNNIRRKMSLEYGKNFGDGERIFQELKQIPEFAEALSRNRIMLVDQLDYEARSRANDGRRGRYKAYPKL